ncbi:MAG: desulfoferrodoxin [Firmicutes bacterium]|nr:desulfoferrodoxin [Bacillota bacterium]
MINFYKCDICNNVIELVINHGGSLACCNTKMTELEANTVDASTEKHVPVVNLNGNTVDVSVGSIPHPMTPEHHISFIYLETNKGGYRKDVVNNINPTACFILENDELPITAYEYCNLHGLWKVFI